MATEIFVESNGKCERCGQPVRENQTVCSSCLFKEILGIDEGGNENE